MYGLIMAGGSGTRLWPKSRLNSPKQLHALVSEKSMLADTVERIKSLIPEKDIWITTHKNYLHKIKEQIPAIPRDNILIEPIPLGTAMGVGVGIMRIYSLDEDATVAVLWSDNYIKKTNNFIKALKLAQKAAQETSGIIIGVNPTFPSTTYGYIQIGEELEEFGKMKVFRIKEFFEKPTLARAKEFMTGWQYLWNSGISVWKAKKFLDLFKKHLPKHYELLTKLKKYFNQNDKLDKFIRKNFNNLEPESIDYAIYEKAKDLATVPADLGWSDIGDWTSLKDVLSIAKKKNLIKGKHIGLDTKNCFILGGERLISTLGVEDLIIVDTDDAILIAHKNHSAKVKDLTKKLEKNGFKDYL